MRDDSRPLIVAVNTDVWDGRAKPGSQKPNSARTREPSYMTTIRLLGRTMRPVAYGCHPPKVGARNGSPFKLLTSHMGMADQPLSLG